MNKKEEIVNTLKKIGNVKDLDSDLAELKKEMEQIGLERFIIETINVTYNNDYLGDTTKMVDVILKAYGEKDLNENRNSK